MYVCVFVCMCVRWVCGHIIGVRWVTVDADEVVLTFSGEDPINCTEQICPVEIF